MRFERNAFIMQIIPMIIHTKRMVSCLYNIRPFVVSIAHQTFGLKSMLKKQNVNIIHIAAGI